MTMDAAEMPGPPTAPPGVDPVVTLVRMRDVPCPWCGYNLRGATAPLCVECGGVLTLEMFERPWVMPRSTFVVLCFIGLTCWMAATSLGLLVSLMAAAAPGGPAGIALLPLAVIAVLGGELWLMIRWCQRPALIHMMSVQPRVWAWVLLALPGIGVCVLSVGVGVFMLVDIAGMVLF